MPKIVLDARKRHVPENAEIKPSSKRVRNLLFARDGAVCRRCKMRAEKWVADHIKPITVFYSEPETFTLANLQTLCVPCDKLKYSEDRKRWPQHFGAGKRSYMDHEEYKLEMKLHRAALYASKLAPNYEI